MPRLIAVDDGPLLGRDELGPTVGVHHGCCRKWRLLLAIGVLLADKWFPSEYTDLLIFAMVSPTWSRRYDFQIIPTINRPVTNQATHHRLATSFSKCTVTGPRAHEPPQELYAFQKGWNGFRYTSRGNM